MGEAKRREELELTPKSKNEKKISWEKAFFKLPWVTKYQMSQYPLALIGFMVLGLIFLMWGFELNSWVG